MEQSTLGTITLVLKNRLESANAVNEVISKFGGTVIGRIGLPYEKRNLNIITLVVDATTDEIGALTGQLGQLPEVTVKSSLAKF